ncbi:hypothetical protein GCM10010185_68850 [Saccharothrix coeruleofusca]|uniref:Uncharacterized protein n=1 Tax=Saccharothrix coeruleofusca TaxID=33919 RepID=A0A918ATD0_9PSEU|nr:hypothetical protein GCM10010185_68850 [Saccharothrix coeruleofusca]
MLQSGGCGAAGTVAIITAAFFLAMGVYALVSPRDPCSPPLEPVARSFPDSLRNRVTTKES